MKKVIVLTGGGTAGHVTPHFALLNDLQKNFSKIAYIGSNSGVEKDLIKNTNITFYGIDAVKLVRGKILTNLALPFKLIRAKHQAKIYLKQIRPNVIFSKGGFVAVPVVLAAKSLKIPVVCHESDLSVGLANKICSKYAKCTCTTFERTASQIKHNAVFSGSPIKQTKISNIDLIKTNLNIPSNKKILLVTGGSLGSVAINIVVRNALSELTKQYFVIHVTGKGNFDNSIKVKNYYQIEFANNMQELIAIANLVISRAGSNTIFELAFAQKPMLLIPLPKGASRGDQVENANYFKEKHFANVLLQSELNKDSLIKAVNETQRQANNLKNNLKNSGLVNGCSKIIEQILKYST